MVVDRRVVLHYIISERTITLGCGLLLPILSHQPQLGCGDLRDGIRDNKAVQANHQCAAVTISSVRRNPVPSPGVLEHLYQVFSLDIVHGGQPLLGFALENEMSMLCSICVLSYALTLCLQLMPPCLDQPNKEARAGLHDVGL